MNSLEILLVALVVVSVALVAALAVEVHASHQLKNRIASNKRVGAASKALIDWLVAADSPDPPELITRLSDRETAELFVLVGTGLQGSELGRLRSLASRLNVIDSWLHMLDSRRWWNRHRALAGLAALAVPDERPVALLGDDHPFVRARAVSWVGRLDFPDASIEPTIALLGDPHGSVRAVAHGVLSQSGPQIAEHLVDLLRSPPDRQTTLAGLDLAAGIHDVRMEQAAARWLSSSDVHLRAQATKVAVRSASVGQIGKYLEDPDPLVRAAALQGASKTRRPELAGLAGRRLEDHEWQVRSSAVTALKKMASPGKVILRAQAQAHASDSPQPD